ncbi:hypothetical protein BKA93DRAFT_738321 [Sparassis latifolia]
MTKKGCNSHIATARSCSWYRRGKLAQLKPLDLEGEGGEMMDGVVQGSDEEKPEDVLDEIYDNPQNDLFHFLPEAVPSILDIEMGQAGPGPSTSAARQQLHRTLDEEDDERLEEVNSTAGYIIQMDDNLHQRWKKLFREQEIDDHNFAMEDGQKDANPFHPFASELDWRVANWMIKDDPGHNAFNRLLAIPGVRPLLSYTNYQF